VVAPDVSDPSRHCGWSISSWCAGSAVRTMIDLLLVHDHTAFRQATAFVLERQRDMHVVAVVATPDQALDVQEHWDLALVDLELPDRPGYELIHDLLERSPAGKILGLTATGDPLEVAAAFEAGAGGVMGRSASIQEIIDAIRTLAGGEALIDPLRLMEMLRLARRDRQRQRLALSVASRLTVRERQVLQALADGKSNKEIAAQFHIAVETQRTHVVNILSKLGAHSQLEALVIAVRHGIVSVSAPHGDVPWTEGAEDRPADRRGVV
jgi:two-component system, NarL family, nitrate/nitrite response regulator NarL